MKITSDGLYPLNNDMNTESTTIYVGDLGDSTVAVGFNDPDGVWTPFPNATLTSHTPLSISHGHDIMLIAFALNVSGEINIETKKQGVGNIEGLLNVIADNTSTPIKEDAPVDGEVYGRKTDPSTGESNWEPVTGEGSTIFVVREPLGEFISTDTQTPSGEGAAGSIVISFGEGGNTKGGEFSVGSDGIILCNLNHTHYNFSIIIRIQRAGSGGVSHVVARMMYAQDGINFNQLGGSFGVKIDDANTVWRESFDVQFSPVVGSRVYFEFARDVASSDSGEIGTFQPSGDLLSWNPIPSAQLTISKDMLR